MAPPEMGLGRLFEMVNRGKKSIALNYRNPRGHQVFLKLVERADVILEGFRPGVMKKWGMDYETVRQVRPDVIYCSLSGYGQDGPYAGRAGHDLNYLSVGGAVALNARPGERPVPYGLPAADLSGGMLAGMAILSALLGRGRSGQGMYLDMALLDGVLSWMAPLAAGAYFDGLQVSAGSLPLLGGLPCFDIYETADGKYLGLAALEPAFWGDFCKVTGREDLLPRQFDRTIGPEIAAVFRQRTQSAWLLAFAGTDGWVEAVNDFKQMQANPQVVARGYIESENGQATGMASPFVFARRKRTPAPALGEHTRQVLLEAGFSDQEVEELLQQGVVVDGK
jgi:crotonobetainyl-CoA:carnitine CoA-transferase CaiB-like acyl-CoA transferase